MMKRHKGNPKPQKGFGFPQHLRERERERQTDRQTDREKNDADENTEHKGERERERGDSKHLGRQGSGPEG